MPSRCAALSLIFSPPSTSICRCLRLKLKPRRMAILRLKPKRWLRRMLLPQYRMVLGMIRWKKSRVSLREAAAVNDSGAGDDRVRDRYSCIGFAYIWRNSNSFYLFRKDYAQLRDFSGGKGGC